MKLHFNAQEKKKVDALLEAKELNLTLADMYLALLNDPSAIGLEDMTNLAMEEKIPLKEAYLSLMMDYWQLDQDNSENKAILEKYIAPAVELVQAEDYTHNPYYQNVKPKEFRNSHYQLVYDHYESYELFPLDDVSIDENDSFMEHSSLGFSTTSLPFLSLNKDGETWMAITPNEINTMAASVKEADGHVLVLGLGLGYYPYMISNKDEVRSIDIIENDPEIITIFKTHLFPFFPHPEKIHVIEADALTYLKKNKKHYDYAFIDLWHNPNDGLYLYLEMKKKENPDRISCYAYWLEKGMKAMLIRAFLILLEEQFSHYQDNHYLEAENDIDKVINALYFETKNLSFSTFGEVKDYLHKLIL